TRLADVPEQIISVCLKLNEREQANNLWKKKPPFGKSFFFFCIHVRLIVTFYKHVHIHIHIHICIYDGGKKKVWYSKLHKRALSYLSEGESVCYLDDKPSSKYVKGHVKSIRTTSYNTMEATIEDDTMDSLVGGKQSKVTTLTNYCNGKMMMHLLPTSLLGCFPSIYFQQHEHHNQSGFDLSFDSAIPRFVDITQFRPVMDPIVWEGSLGQIATQAKAKLIWGDFSVACGFAKPISEIEFKTQLPLKDIRQCAIDTYVESLLLLPNSNY
ncbi:hypothetical protein RFI_13398, partial [Reticulomyxa filosa]